VDAAVVTDGSIHTVLSDTEQQTKKNGFDRGLQPDRIVTVSQTDGNLMFEVAWKNSNESESDLIEASVVYRKCPLLALEFFKNAFETSVSDETLLAVTNE